MSGGSGFVGRKAERARLESLLESASEGRGSLVLVSGEAGVGKTRLVSDAAKNAGVPIRWGRASERTPTPYGPPVEALRAHLRDRPGAFDGIGPLRPHLALVMPELGGGSDASDRATMAEAVRRGLSEVAAEGPAIVVLDDLQWSDEATFELLAGLPEALQEVPLLVVGIYRSDGLPREHSLRALRHSLRRSGRLEEIVLQPLELAETTEVAAGIMGGELSPSLAAAIHDRTQGVCFFVEELSRALRVAGVVAPGRRGLELVGDDVPLPDTVRDAVLAATAELTEDGREAAGAAATAGLETDVELLETVCSEAGLGELFDWGILSEENDGTACFRHALSREALYANVPWSRRRALHREFGEALEAADAPAAEIATHWLGARDESRAREALLRAAGDSAAVHAYRDAAHAGRQALDLWPEGEEPDRRLDALVSYAASAGLCGEHAEAIRAWREICTIRSEGVGFAEAQRSLARLHDLRGDRDAAFAARQSAAEAFEAAGNPAEAAVQRLALGNYLRASANYEAAAEMARSAEVGAGQAGRRDLQLRAKGLEGVVVAKGGAPEEGLEIVRKALAAALDENLTPAAADLYQRLSLVLYDAADYGQAQETLAAALELCRTTDEPGTEVACVTCMVYVLRERGEWAEALRIGRELINSDTAAWVAEGLVGMIYAHQGKLSSARRLLTSAHATASGVDHFNMTVDSTTGLARVAAAEGRDDEAADLCSALLERWRGSEDHHYSVKGLRWSAAYLARRGDLAGAHSCAEALAGISSETGHADSLAALAHAIAETGLAEGDAETAAEQLGRAVELHGGLDLPLERAEIEVRAGVALAAAGERDAALERLGSAYRAARKLGARPLAAEAAGEVSALGESVGRRLGSRAVADAEGVSLTPRELEVLRLVAVGRTNREVAEDLVLSTRTVDMHVRNVLRKLDCRSRVEAAHRAGELGMLTEAGAK